jgi:penicillin-binding protein 2
MLKLFPRRKKRRSYGQEIVPEDIFLDSSNLPEFDQDQMEGRMEKPISERYITVLGICFVLLGLFLGYRAYALQIVSGEKYAEYSKNNSLTNDVLFADRGLIIDRRGELLAWNTQGETIDDFSWRNYIDAEGFGNLLGFVKYPAKDKSGFYYKLDISGSDGIESYFDDLLSGENGEKIVEEDVRGKVQSESTIRPTVEGKNAVLSIDAEVQKTFYNTLKQTVETSGFVGGGGIIMDVHTGEVLSVVTYPEFDPEVMTDGKNKEVIEGYSSDKRNPFLDRAINGLYAPGSIVKPFFAIAALNEGVVTPDTKILSTGSITIPNPYNPDLPSIFRDWKAHGWTDVRQAIAVSSDVYFYTVGGGYEGQKGIGISKLDKYASMFGFGAPVEDSFFSTNNNGVIPTPEWKLKAFNGDPWRLGDTYNTSIGQFGFQVTAVQAVRALSALVTEGTAVDPQIIKKGEEGYKESSKKTVQGIDPKYYQVAKEGMRMAVTEGTMQVLSFPDIHIAGKTGTAEVGFQKDYVNSWVTGYFPYENPRYAFALVLERGPSKYAEGASASMRRVFEAMRSSTTTAEYLQ